VSIVRRSSITGLLSLLAIAVVALGCLPSSAGAFSASQGSYLRAANKGIKNLHRWWVRGLRWYTPVLGGTKNASLWQTVPLFEAFAGLDIAQPSKRHSLLLNWFAQNGERFLNSSLEPVPGFGNKPDQEGANKTAWFDDNGWWGLAYLDAYRATGDQEYLTDAEIAQNFISVSGWDSTPGRPGGLWWNSNESFYAGETLAGGTLLSARLYALTHDKHYLDDALKYIAWADVWLTDPATGLYARLRKPGTYPDTTQPGTTTTSSTTTTMGTPVLGAQPTTAGDRKALAQNPDEAAKLEAAGGGTAPAGEAAAAAGNYPPFDPSPMPYVNGPMILAHRIICDQTGKQYYCARARQLANTTLQVYSRFWMGPQFDFWYDRSMLEFAQLDHSENWYAIVQSSARSALRKAHDRSGLYLRTWYGKKPAAASAPNGSLQLHAANAALFAWMGALGQ
jgi:glycosyl hydrolase family 76